MAHQALVQEIRALQKSNPTFRYCWDKYCDKESDGTRDPNRHDAAFLQAALRALKSGSGAGSGGSHFVSGHNAATDGGGSGAGLLPSPKAAAHQHQHQHQQHQHPQQPRYTNGYPQRTPAYSQVPSAASTVSVAGGARAIPAFGANAPFGAGGGGGGGRGGGRSEYAHGGGGGGESQRFTGYPQHQLQQHQQQQQRQGRKGAGGQRQRRDDDGAAAGFDGAGSDRDHTLVQAVKEKQKDEAWRRLWHAHCDTHAEGTYDPSRHPAHFLSSALKQISRQLGGGEGSAAAVSTGGGGGSDKTSDAASDVPQAVRSLAAKVKEQQRDSGWHTRWADHCHVHGDGTRDPSRHTADFLAAALDALLADHKTERHAELAKEVADAASEDPLFQGRWQRYCEKNSDGTTDPEAHEAAFLQAALEEVGRVVEQEREHEELVKEVKAKQRAEAQWRTRWTDYCVMYADGRRDPAHHDVHFLRRALRDLAPESREHRVGLRSCDPTELIEEVKAKQRADAAWQDRWIEYCESHSDGTCDPSHHDAGFLRRALREIGTSSRKFDALCAQRVAEVQLLCEARRKAQRAKAFERADTLRSLLWNMGVEVDDKRKAWRSDDGLCGFFPGPEDAPLPGL